MSVSHCISSKTKIYQKLFYQFVCHLQDNLLWNSKLVCFKQLFDIVYNKLPQILTKWSFLKLEKVWRTSFKSSKVLALLWKYYWFTLMVKRYGCRSVPTLLPSANEVAERYCFHKRVSRILSTGGCLSARHPLLSDRHSPRADTPLQADTSLNGHSRGQTPPPHPCRRPLRWTVRILLESILVFYLFSNKKFHEIDK